ncbi:ABC transporter substrate-binding protein [Microbacterium sp. 22242]|uniref:ABC transporter substrate-binding protein n=1 Tax=Microbacterium sp. 22242 TaxID=3453896 RepID=UPI003F845452
MKTSLKAALGAAAVLSLGLSLAGCSEPVSGGGQASSTPKASSTISVAFDQKLHDMLPKAMQDAKVVKVGTTAYTPPIVYLDTNNKDIIGIDADLMSAMSTMFGVRFEMTDLGTFDALIPSMQSNRFDMSISGMGDTVEREKIMDLIDYMYDGKTIMVQKGNPKHVKTMKDLCGLKVAVAVGTAQEALVQAQSAKCVTPIDVMSIPKQPDVLVAVQTGRADATVGGYATGVYTTQHQIGNGVGLEAIASVREQVGYNSIAFTKTNAQLRDAVLKGFQKLIDSGKYKEIMTRYELGNLAVTSAKLNDAANVAKSGS